MQRFINFVMLLCYLNGSVTALICYPDYCQNVTDFIPIPGVQCLLTRVQRGKDCSEHKFKDISGEPPKDVTAKFVLRAYTYKESSAKATAFNLSITDIDFYGLVTRYQNLWDKSQSACRYIKLYGNETYPAPRELYVSCPFSNSIYEIKPYRLDYVVTGKGYKYRKQYVFYVPKHEYIEEGIDLKNYIPFVYIDRTHEPLFILHVQPLPEMYNITRYKIWLINNDTDSVMYANVLSVSNDPEIKYNFTAHNFTGTFYFKVSPVHSECGEYGCMNATTPPIVIKETSHRLLLMIISTVWIPPVILYVPLHYFYKLYKKETLKRREKLKYLLEYSHSEKLGKQEKGETENRLTSESASMSNNRISALDVSETFVTNIDKLDLLGECEKVEGIICKCPKSDNNDPFQINQLDL